MLGGGAMLPAPSLQTSNRPDQPATATTEPDPAPAPDHYCQEHHKGALGNKAN